MVSVQVFDEGHDVHAESVDQRPDLLLLSRLGEEVDHLLDSPRSVHVQADADEITSDRVDDGRSLLFGRVLEELLAEVVAERIRHELGEVAVSLVEDHVSVSGIALLELLLEVSAPVLILAEREEVALEVLDPDARESVDYTSADRPGEQRLWTHTLGRSRLACSSSPWVHRGKELRNRNHHPRNRTGHRARLAG